MKRKMEVHSRQLRYYRDLGVEIVEIVESPWCLAVAGK